MATAKKRAKRRPGASTTGKVKNVKADQTNWRRRLMQSRLKFDDVQKELYLLEFSKHGLKGKSAEAAGVDPQTVLNHLKNDPDFAAAHDTAYQRYKDIISAEVRARGIEGWTEPVYSKGIRALDYVQDDEGRFAFRNRKTGQLVWTHDPDFDTNGLDRENFKTLVKPAGVRRFSDRMLELEAKRHMEEYRDKQTVDLTAGGVIVSPPDVTPEDWTEQMRLENATREPPEGADDAGA